MAGRLLTLLLVLCTAPVVAAPPEPIPGTLIIAGGGKLPDGARSEFFRAAGGEGKARIVVIPTASASARDPGTRETAREPWEKLKPEWVKILHAADRKDAESPDRAAILTGATGVWLGGGDQSRLMKIYRGTPVEAGLRDVLARGGVVGGTSAGAAALPDLMIEGGNPTARTGPGLGLLPGVVIDQHFSERSRLERLRSVIDANPARVGIGIDENTALVVRGRTIRVVGEGTATVYWAKSAAKPARTDRLKSGGRLDLVQIRRAAAARAAREPFPPAVAAEPVVRSGSLVIVGGGGTTPEIMDRFFALAGGKDSLIVAVPTASGRKQVSENSGDVRFLKRFGATNVRVLHTVDRKQADDPEFSKILLEARGVWFGGGRQWRFVDAYEGTLTEKRFREVLDRGGVIGGSSAGASIQSEYMPRGHPLGNMVMAAEGYERGFGYLPGCAVDQHFFARKRTADMTGLMKLYPQLLGIGIDESTALVVTGHAAEVIGKSKVAFYDYRNGVPDGPTDYVEVPAGGKYDLKARAVIK